MKKHQIRQSLILLLTAAIWGSAFVAQSVGMDYVGPFTFNCVRFIIGGVFLIPCIMLLERKNSISLLKQTGGKSNKKMLLIGGISCGICLFSGSALQQLGVMHTSVGKAGFITTFYIILVPVLGLFFRKRCGFFVWTGVVLALAGLYFLCIKESFSVQKGDVLVFFCAVAFSVHILVIDYFVDKTDPVKMSCIQFLICGVISGIVMLFTETPNLGSLVEAWKPILYTGILSSGVGYTLQIIGQKGMNPTVASLILSLESVIAVLAGFLILHQALSTRELFGCVLMFGAIIFAQIPPVNREKHHQSFLQKQ